MTPARKKASRWSCAALIATLASCAPIDEEYEPLEVTREGLVTAAASPVVARKQHTLGLRGGLVYVVGGNETATPSVEVLNPTTNTFSSGPALITNRRSHAMATLADGTFLVLGGIGTAGVLSSGEKLPPGATAWQSIAPMPAALYGHSATVLADGRVLVAGGVGYQTSTWLYDPALNAWSTTGALLAGRMRHGAARLADGRVLIAGGGTMSSSSTNTAEIYSPATGTWSSAGTMATAYSSTDIAVVTTGPRAGVAVIAGSGTAVQQFSPSTGTFSSLGPSMAAHYNGRLLSLADGSVLLFGDSYGVLAIEQLGASASTWATVDQMPASRTSSPGVQLADGRVVVVGGTAYPAGGGNEFARADAFYWSPSGGCTPRTCASAGATCGTIADNCGGTLNCGTCGTGQVCGASNTCVPACTPATCASLGATCGNPSNGCGGTLSCGTCGTGQVCGSSYTCVPSCTPTTCAALGLTCGTAPDGCGGTLVCGPACPPPGTVNATYDPVLKAPLCATNATVCSATTTGRANLGPEANAPNTLGATCADGTSGSFHWDESVDAVRVRSNSGVLTAGGLAQVEVDVWAYSSYSSDALDVFITTNPSAPSWTLVATRVPTQAGAQTLIVPLTLPGSTSATRFAVRAQFRYGGSASPCLGGSFNDRDDVVFAVAGGASPGIANGGFEAGLSSWTASSNASADSSSGLSHGGTTHAVLRPQYGSPASVTQSLTIPAGITTLSLWVRPETAYTTVLDCNIRVTITSPGITWLDTAVASNLTNPWTWSNVTVDITRFAGAPVTLQVSSASTVYSSTEFFRLDDLTLY